MSFILIRHIGTTEAEMNKLTLRMNDKAANSGRFFGGRKEKKRQSGNVKVAQGLEWKRQEIGKWIRRLFDYCNP